VGSAWLLIANSILLGLGLAMDAFSVSLVHGMNEPSMTRRRKLAVSGTFAGFQFAMPVIGWLCVTLVEQAFVAFQRYIPWIAMILLSWIGGKMLWEGLRGRGTPDREATSGSLLMQGIATSIDALSVGFTIADSSWPAALTEALIIGAVTFAICLAGLRIGKFFGTKLAGKASILGGVILIAIGLEIFLKGVF
jgi:putative Mn2+ efflux pump MntP